MLQIAKYESQLLGDKNQEESGERCRGAEAFGRDGVALYHYLGVWTEAIKKGGNAEIIGLHPQ